MTRLEELYLQENRLTGSVPTAFANLRSLRGLHLARNEISSLPAVALPPSLKRLRLGHNDSLLLSAELKDTLPHIKELHIDSVQAARFPTVFEACAASHIQVHARANGEKRGRKLAQRDSYNSNLESFNNSNSRRESFNNSNSPRESYDDFADAPGPFRSLRNPRPPLLERHRSVSHGRHEQFQHESTSPSPDRKSSSAPSTPVVPPRPLRKSSTDVQKYFRGDPEQRPAVV